MGDEFSFLWNGIEPVVRILLIGTVTFVAIVFMLRVAGKRTLAQMNAFDFIITITIGSAFGRILTAKEVSIVESITTFVLLFLLQYLLAWFEMKSKTLANIVTAPPTLLYYKGEFVEKNLIKERVRKEDVYGAVRQDSLKSMDEVEAVIIESSGSFSVIKKSDNDSNSALVGVLDGTDGIKP